MAHRDVADVAIGRDGRVYVCTRFDARIMIYERDGTFVRAFGEGVVERPHGITLGTDGSIWCVDQSRHAVYRFDPFGALLQVLGTPGRSSTTGYDGKRQTTVESAAGPFNQPTKLAVAPDGRLVVADGYGNARVHWFDGDGRYLTSWGQPGSQPGQFRLPHSVCFDGSERLLVADRENDRIQVFDGEGAILDIWPIQRPAALAVEGGLIYVAALPRRPGQTTVAGESVPAYRPPFIAVLDETGAEQFRFGSPDPEAPDGFAAPHGLDVRDGDLYVAEVVYSEAVHSQVAVAEGCWPLKKFRRVEAPPSSDESSQRVIDG